MNVYVIEVGQYSDRDVVAVFSDLLGAKQYAEEKYKLDPFTWDDSDDTSWHAWPGETVAIYKFKLDSASPW